MNPVVEQILAFLGQLVVYAGGSTALAYILFKTLGEKWLSHRFDERLRLLEHGYAVELSKLKQRLETAASGLNRIHQKEFEVLPEAWGLLDQAMGTLGWVVSPVQQYADVSRMDEETWREFIDGFEGFSPPDKRYLLELAGGRDREFRRLYDAYKGRLAEDAIREFQKYAARNSIFLPEELRVQFDEIRDLLWSASTSKTVGAQAQDWKLQNEGWKKLQENAQPLFEEIRKRIQERIAKQTELNVEGLNMFNKTPER